MCISLATLSIQTQCCDTNNDIGQLLQSENQPYFLIFRTLNQYVYLTQANISNHQYLKNPGNVLYVTWVFIIIHKISWLISFVHSILSGQEVKVDSLS